MKKSPMLSRRIREIVNKENKLGHPSAILSGNTRLPSHMVTVDPLNRTVRFSEVASKKGSNFRIDRDENAFNNWTVIFSRITFDGKVDD